MVMDPLGWTCWTCETQVGMLLPIFWECPLIQTFWQQALHIIQKLTDFVLFDNQAAALMNLTPMSRKRYDKSLLKNLLNFARACISMWKQQSPSPIVTR